MIRFKQVDFNPFAQEQDQVALNDAQQEIWLSCAIGGEPASLVYNECWYLKLSGQLDRSAFERAFEDLIVRHQALSSFLLENGEGITKGSGNTVTLLQLDYSNMPVHEQREAIEQEVARQQLSSFDLTRGPLMRAALCKTGAGEHYLIFTLHHIIADPYSQNLVLQELARLYAFHTGRGPALTAPAAQLKDYLQEQAAFAKSQAFSDNNAYWLSYFNDQLPQTSLPTDAERSKLHSYAGSSIVHPVSAELAGALATLAGELEIELSALTCAFFELFLFKQTGQEQILLGIPSAGRAFTALPNLVGHFQQILPLRATFERELTLKAYLLRRAEHIRQAYAHEQFSVRLLLEHLTSKGASSMLLTPVIFSYRSPIDQAVSFPELQHQFFRPERQYENFELYVSWFEDPKDPYLVFSYNTVLFKEQTIREMTRGFSYLMQEGIKNPDIRLKNLHLQDPKVHLEKVKRWNDTAAPVPNDKTLLDYFEKQARQQGEKSAIRFHGRDTSFERLASQSSQLAHKLIAQGVEAGDCIAILLDRSPRLMTSMLAILKCGATFVPIDPEFPPERIGYMLEDAQVKITITSSKYSSQFSSKTAQLILEDVWKELPSFSTDTPRTAVSGKDRAYILYTSGSTGKPKGVQILHSNLLNLLLSMQKSPGIQPADRFLASTTISFDISVMEIFLPLISGASIVLLDEKDKKNGKAILDIIKAEKITHVQGGPPLYMLMLYEDWNEKLPIKVLCAGEALSKSLAEKLLIRCEQLWNMYGPTETTIYSIIKHIQPNPQTITIGKPIDNTQVYLLDKDLQLVAQGQEGEIYIAGAGVAPGYLNRPELSSEKFLPNPFSENPDDKIYQTGDIGVRMPDGEILCLGRIDHQVKIRGIRIELGEIEHSLKQLPGIAEALVTLLEEGEDDKSLSAYILLDPAAEAQQPEYWIGKWKTELKEVLPQYMLPRDYIILPEFPLTPNGKIDRKALPKPAAIRSERLTPYTAPGTPLEQKLASLWEELLHMEKVGIDDHFFEHGGTSLTAVKCIVEIKKRYGFDIPVTRLYQYTTIRRLATVIEKQAQKKFSEPLGQPKTETPLTGSKEADEQEIAVIAMSGRFPQANSVEALWQLLLEEKEGTSFFPKEQLDASIPLAEKQNPAYIPARGYVEGIEDFDANFFGIPPRLAQLMDPQQRIFLEVCWEALEQSGYTADHYKGSIGVYAGCAKSYYYLNQVQHYPGLIQNLGALQVGLVNEKDYLSSRVAYTLDLKGPAVTVQSACSTSLLAIAQAVESLRSGKCTLALAGGASVITPIKIGYLYQEGSMLSADGHCRPFDANAAGTVFSDGAGVVLLKPLQAALKDGDTIYATIKGIGVNNDGSDKSSFFAPSSHGQAGAIKMAIQDARVPAESISYVETHGTATPLGDPIEIEGLKEAFGSQKKQFCALGSVKSNIGHLNTASGVTGFIKACLSLHHKQLPATLHYKTPNPHIDFSNSPFYVNDRLRDWNLRDASSVRRAGVSSFGVGGTNVHVVLEEAPEIRASERLKKETVLVNWSAKKQQSLQKYQQSLLEFVKANPEIPLSELAYSLHTTRSDFTHRAYLVARTREQLIGALEKAVPITQQSALRERIENVIFMFPGQGAQYLNMGKELYEKEPYFARQVDKCIELLTPVMGENLLEVIFNDSLDASERLNNTYYTQPALFVVEYALAKLIMHWGIQPSLLMGHSIGEFVAAHLSGVFSLKDALMLIATRGKLMAGLAAGKMLAVRISAAELEASLPKGLSLAAANSPKLSVVAGPELEVSAFARALKEKGIVSTLLPASHAFHSWMMEEIVAPFTEIVRGITLNKPNIPIMSTVSGDWLSDQQAMDPGYWAAHLRKTVQFSPAAKNLLQQKKGIYVECGPRNVLSNLIKQQGTPGLSSISLLSPQSGQSELDALTQTLGALWMQGLQINWANYYSGRKWKKWKIPEYAFAKTKLWVDAPPAVH